MKFGKRSREKETRPSPQGTEIYESEKPHLQDWERIERVGAINA